MTARKQVALTDEQRSRHKAIRDAFRDWRPSAEELIASGEATRLGLQVIYSPAKSLLADLKQFRRSSGISLAEVARRCGIDRSVLTRLENGQDPNLTLETLWRYAAAIGKRLLLSSEDVGVRAAAKRKKARA